MPMSTKYGGNGYITIGTWNTGQNKQRPEDPEKGFDPTFQMERHKAGDSVDFSFELWEKYMAKDVLQNRAGYFEPAWSYAKENNRSISLIGENWEELFATLMPWKAAVQDHSIKDHPFIETGDGDRYAVASPYGDNLHHWRELGRMLGEYIETEFAQHYPGCYSVRLFNNCETGFAKHNQERQDYRFPVHLRGDDEQAIFEARDRGYQIRRAALIEALLEACPTWRSCIQIFAYGGFGNEFGASEAKNNANQRLYNQPWNTNKLPYYSSANTGYVHNWQTWEIGKVRSPMVEACNTLYALQKYREIHNPSFCLEPIYWNGKKDTPERWQGCVNGVMWLLRGSVHRLFTGSSQTRAETMDRDWQPMINAAKKINRHLLAFWMFGELVPNRWRRDWNEMPALSKYDKAEGYGHPYHWDHSMPAEWGDPGDRWFLQHVPLNERFKVDMRYNDRYIDTWQADREHKADVAVFAIAVKLNGDYMIYAFAPNNPEGLKDVEIHLCPNGPVPELAVKMDVAHSGTHAIFTDDGLLQEVIE